MADKRRASVAVDAAFTRLVDEERARERAGSWMWRSLRSVLALLGWRLG